MNALIRLRKVSFPVDLLLGIPGIGLSAITLDKERVVFQIGSNDDSSPCPKCNSPSLKVHSKYSRTILDLPFSGTSAEARLSVRKFFCASEALKRFAQGIRQDYDAVKAALT